MSAAHAGKGGIKQSHEMTFAAKGGKGAKKGAEDAEEDGARGGGKGKYKTFIMSDAVFEVEARYSINESVGTGAYGVVCSASDLKTGALVAVKQIQAVLEHRSLAKRTLRELKLLRMFSHENVMALERVMRPRSRDFSDIYLVSELLETDLACVIRSPQTLTDEHSQFFLYQVLRGLKYMHSANVIHRDLKPRNLLVNSNCDLKICDLGLARVDDPNHRDKATMSDYVATRWYRPPEVILSRERYTKAVDMWAVGCILAELLSRRPLFPGRDSFHQITLIISVLGTPDPKSFSGGRSRAFVTNLPKKPKVPFAHLFPKANPLACDLLERLLTFDPAERITVEEALKHPYLAELHCEEDEPTCDDFDTDEFLFEYASPTKQDLRELLYAELMENYEVDDYEPSGPLETMHLMQGALPKSGRRGRRKSF